MDAEEWVESFSRGIMCLLGIVGNNWLAFSSIPRSKSQLKTNDALFINLAVSNLITNYMVDLPDTMADFAGRWFFGLTYCRIFRFCADLSETSSIFSTLFISAYWYQKLVGSLKRGGAPVRLDNMRLVAALLGGSWTVAIIFSIPHLIFVTVAEEDEEVDCLDNFPSPMAQQVYEILYLSLANAIPIAGIVFASIQIVITLMQNQQRVSGMGAAEPLPNKPQQEVPHSTGSGQAPQESQAGQGQLSTVYTGAPEGAAQQQQQPQAAATATTAAPKAPTKGVGSSGSSGQVRAAKSVVAVASVFLVCWLTHLLLRITSNVKTNEVVVEVASYIAASYTCIIPYIFLHGVKKLTCACKRRRSICLNCCVFQSLVPVTPVWGKTRFCKECAAEWISISKIYGS